MKTMEAFFEPIDREAECAVEGKFYNRHCGQPANHYLITKNCFFDGKQMQSHPSLEGKISICDFHAQIVMRELLKEAI
jgi:hypothetical protein